MSGLGTARIAISRIKHGALPAADSPGVQKIANSIVALNGALLNPITVDPDTKLIAGRHRLAAAKALGWETIDVRVMPFTGARAELATLDENLARSERTALEIGNLLKRRKVVYEQLFPDSSKPGRKGNGDTVSSFTADTAEKTGFDQRSIQRHIQAATDLTPAAQAVIATTPAADSITELVALSKLDPKEQLKVAKQMKKTGDTVKRSTKGLKRREQLEQVRIYVPPAGRYPVVSVDFSWKYDDALDGPGMDRGLPYPPMEVQAIVDFIRGPLDEKCDRDALLACWVTNPILLDSDTWPRVQLAIEGIGFRPRKLITWRKTNDDGSDFVGLGTGPRNNTEQLVLFSRGNVVFNETGAEHGRPIQFTCFSAPVGENSEKPAKAYELLEAMVPYTSRLELFARKPRDGWVTSGSELPAPSQTLLAHQDGDRFCLSGKGCAVVAAHPNGAQLPLGSHVDPASGMAGWLIEAAEKGNGTVPAALVEARQLALRQPTAETLIDWKVVVDGVDGAPSVVHGVGGSGPADLPGHADRRRRYVVHDNEPHAPTFLWTCDGNRNDGRDYASADEAKAAAEKNEALVRKLVAGGTERRKNEKKEPAPPVTPKRKPKMRIEDTDKEINT
jgi:N6-adenosine-specific RNA methylase IME4